MLVCLVGQVRAAGDVGSVESRRPTLKSIYRQEHLPGGLFEDETTAIVFVFMSTSCPIAQLYVPRLDALYDEVNGIDRRSTEVYRDRIRFFAVYSNAGENIYDVALHAHDADYRFPALLDEDGRFADELRIERTPEVAVVDRELQVLYRGAIDDQYYKGGAKLQPTRHYLKDALHQILAGKEVTRAETIPQGCLLERLGRDVPPERVTFYRDVLPILQEHCQFCHRQDEIGPFTLTSYDDAVRHAEMLREVVRERRMPPWAATSPLGFRNDRRLSAAQIEVLSAWVETGLDKGDVKDAPPAVQWPTGDWHIGEPDLVIETPEVFEVPATGVLEYRYFRVKTNFDKDVWIRGVEAQPGNRKVVHHILVHQMEAGEGEFGTLDMLRLWGLTSRATSILSDFLPGDENAARRFADNQGMLLKAGNDLIFETHYIPVGTVQQDRSRAALLISETRPEREVKSTLFMKPRGRFLLPKRNPHVRFQDVYWFDKDVRILAVRPHMHFRGKNYRLELVHADEQERKETVLQVPIWDVNWQKTYFFKEPLVLPAGKELLATATFDNSSFNPGNPNPDDEVRWGQQTFNEMFNSYVLYEEIEQ
jgi:hypothetical protein